MTDRNTYDLRIRLYEKRDADLISVYLYCVTHDISFNDLCRSILHRYMNRNFISIKVPGMSPLTHEKQSYILNVGLYYQADAKIINFIRTLSKYSVNTVVKQIMKFYFGPQTIMAYQENFDTYSEEELTEVIQANNFDFIETHKKGHKIKRTIVEPMAPPPLLELDNFNQPMNVTPTETISIQPKSNDSTVSNPAPSIQQTELDFSEDDVDNADFDLEEYDEDANANETSDTSEDVDNDTDKNASPAAVEGLINLFNNQC